MTAVTVKYILNRLFYYRKTEKYIEWGMFVIQKHFDVKS